MRYQELQRVENQGYELALSEYNYNNDTPLLIQSAFRDKRSVECHQSIFLPSMQWLRNVRSI